MGCDIHFFVEEWDGTSPIKEIVGEPAWKPIGGEHEEWDEDGEHLVRSWNWGPSFHDRNYLLFSIIADVRNNDSVKPISRPRGLPKDVSPEIKMVHDYDEGDAHSTSWLTLSEVLEYDWEGKGFAEDIMTGPMGYLLWKEKKDTFYLYLSRVRITTESKKLSISEMERVVSEMEVPSYERFIGGNKDSNSNIYTVVHSKESYAELCSNFVDFVTQLKEKCKDDDFDRIRLVFWFDN